MCTRCSAFFLAPVGIMSLEVFVECTQDALDMTITWYLKKVVNMTQSVVTSLKQAVSHCSFRRSVHNWIFESQIKKITVAPRWRWKSIAAKLKWALISIWLTLDIGFRELFHTVNLSKLVIYISTWSGITLKYSSSC